MKKGRKRINETKENIMKQNKLLLVCIVLFILLMYMIGFMMAGICYTAELEQQIMKRDSLIEMLTRPLKIE